MAAPATSPGTSTNLPAELTSFVGRRHERVFVRKLLSESRLVTLTGFGGVGKTRLATRVAADLRRAFPDDVWLVPLEELTDPALLTDTLAGALGIRGQSQRSAITMLIEFLEHRHLLLVLDNCEHLIDACAALAEELLRACPRLHILATSREPLRISGETAHSLSPLSVPGAEHDESAPLNTYEGIRLFVDRARSVLPDFDINEENRLAVAGICRQLDGIPLALELAAVRLRAMSASEILERITGHRQLLTMGSRNAPDRQRTMNACIQWSYELCSEDERELWARASVFPGGFELDAAEQVFAERDDETGRERVADLLLSLVEKSILIRSEHGGRVRYRMLETLRRHGAHQLIERQESENMRRRHRDWCADLVCRAEEGWTSADQIAWMRRLSREQSNLLAALKFCASESGEEALGLDIAGRLQNYAIAHGLFRQLRYWLDRLLAQTSEPNLTRVRALRTTCRLAVMQGDLDVASPMLDEGERLAEELGQPAKSMMNQVKGLHATFAGDLTGAIEAYEQASDGFRALDDSAEHAHTLVLLGLAYALAGDTEHALACHRECLEITGPTGESWFTAYSLWHAGLAVSINGDPETATRMEKDSVTLFHQMDEQMGKALTFEALAWICAESDPARAATLLGVASAVWRLIDTSTERFPNLYVHHKNCEDTVRTGLGETTYTAAFEHGASLSPDTAADYALNTKTAERREPKGHTSVAPTALTPRERQIAELLADGLPNKEIASKLVISRRTAESHIEHILAKLGFNSRTQIVAWMTEQRVREKNGAPASPGSGHG